MAGQRSDARRNQAALRDAAAAVFVRAGVSAPLREIASEAGVGTATIYRHFPTRADLILAVYRQQVADLAELGTELVQGGGSPHAALLRWADQFVDFVITKQGLGSVMQSGEKCYDPLHAYFVDYLEPVCRCLLEAAVVAGEIEDGQDPYELLRAIGSLCVGAATPGSYDARRLTRLLVNGLRLA